MAAAKAMPIKKGRAMILQPGMNWYQIMRMTKITPDIRKSTKLVMMELVGIISLGK
jgi:hypothetical protein